MKRARTGGNAFAPALVIHDSAMLLAIFYAPVFWGGFNSSGLTMAATLVSVAALSAVVWRWGALGRGPAVIPNAIHLPALLLLAITAISGWFSASHHSSSLEFTRLTTGVVLFLLVANRALMPAAPFLPVMVVFASSLLVLPFVQTSGESGPWLDVFTGLAAICVCAFLIVHRRSPDPVRRWVEAVALSAGLAVALCGIREKILAHYSLDNPTWQIFSTFFNPNELAGFLTLALPLGVGVALGAVRFGPPTRLWRIGLATVVWTCALGCGIQAFRGDWSQGLAVPPWASYSARGLAAGLCLGAGLLVCRIYETGRGARALCWLATLTTAAALSLTNSKGAYLAVLVALAVFVLLFALISQRPRRNAGLVLGVYVLAVLAAVALVIVSHGIRTKITAAFGAQTASNMFRILTWKGTLIMALHHPWVGIGPAAFKSVYMNYAVVGYTEAAHENYLQVLAEQGVFGAVAFLWLLGAVLFTGWRALRRVGADRGSQLLAAGGICGVVAFLVHGLVDYGWYIGATSLTLWFLAGVLAHLAHGREFAVVPTPALGDAPRGKRRRLNDLAPAPPAPAAPVHSLPWPKHFLWRALLVAWLTGALCFRISVAAKNAFAQEAVNRGDQAWTEAVAAQQQGDLALAVSRYRESLALYQAAVAYDPGWAVLHEKLGRNLRGKEGEQHLRQALALEPMSFAPYLSLAKLYDEDKRFPEAVKAYQESLKRFPQHTRALRLLAETYQKMGEEQRALDTYRRLAALGDKPINRYRAVDIDVDANFAYAYYALGRAELRLLLISSDFRGEQEAALYWFRRVVAVVDEYFKPGGGYSLDQMFARVGKPRTNRAEELLPLKAKALWRMADIYDSTAKPAEATAKREEAVRASAEVARLVADEDKGGQPCRGRLSAHRCIGRTVIKGPCGY